LHNLKQFGTSECARDKQEILHQEAPQSITIDIAISLLLKAEGLYVGISI